MDSFRLSKETLALPSWSAHTRPRRVFQRTLSIRFFRPTRETKRTSPQIARLWLLPKAEVLPRESRYGRGILGWWQRRQRRQSRRLQDRIGIPHAYRGLDYGPIHQHGVPMRTQSTSEQFPNEILASDSGNFVDQAFGGDCFGVRSSSASR